MTTTDQGQQPETSLQKDAAAATAAARASQASPGAKAVSAGQAQQDPQAPAAQGAQSPAFSMPNTVTLTPNAATIQASPVLPQQQAASTALRQVVESADQMRSDGKTNVEVQVKLDDGQQLTVRLQMSQGSVHPIFKTESPELRQAIEQNWAGFRSSASERGLQISTPVFESPSGQGAFNSFGSHDQSREPAGDPSDAEVPYPRSGLLPANRPTVSQTPAASPIGSGVQLYA
jgi:hypothetical protein